MMLLKRNIFLILFLFQTAALAQDRCAQLFDTTSDIYTKLIELHKDSKKAIAEQSQFDRYIKPSGGGACASVTAFNLLQGLRLINRESLLSPQVVLKKAYLDIPELIEGRVSNAQMLQLIEHFLENYLNQSPAQINIQVSSTHLIKSHEPVEKTWLKWNPSLLQIKENEIKMLVYTVARPTGQLLGRHFVILKNTSKQNRVSVLDPNEPLRDLQYELLIEQNGDQPVSIKLAKPNSTSSSVVLTLDSIFTVQLE